MKNKIYRELNCMVFKINDNKLEPFIFTFPYLLNNIRD